MFIIYELLRTRDKLRVRMPFDLLMWPGRKRYSVDTQDDKHMEGNAKSHLVGPQSRHMLVQRMTFSKGILLCQTGALSEYVTVRAQCYGRV